MRLFDRLALTTMTTNDRFDPGLDADELAEARAHAQREDQAEQRPGGELIIRRRSAEVMLPIFGLVLAGILVGLEQPWVALGLGVVVVVVVVAREGARTGRISIGADGSISLPGKLEPMHWRTLRRVSFRLRHPAGASELGKAAFETAAVELETASGRRVRLARGPLFQRSPVPRARSWPWLGNLLQQQARAAGMRIEKRSAHDWSAHRH